MIKRILAGLFCLLIGLWFLDFHFQYQEMFIGVCGVILGIWHLAVG